MSRWRLEQWAQTSGTSEFSVTGNVPMIGSSGKTRADVALRDANRDN